MLQKTSSPIRQSVVLFGLLLLVGLLISVWNLAWQSLLESPSSSPYFWRAVPSSSLAVVAPCVYYFFFMALAQFTRDKLSGRSGGGAPHQGDASNVLEGAEGSHTLSGLDQFSALPYVQVIIVWRVIFICTLLTVAIGLLFGSRPFGSGFLLGQFALMVIVLGYTSMLIYRSVRRGDKAGALIWTLFDTAIGVHMALLCLLTIVIGRAYASL